MMKELKSQIKPTLLSMVVLTLLTGFAYPALVTGLAQVLFPHQANGSLILSQGKPVGSELIGQPFSDPKHFWSRPSATGPYPYNSSSSSGSNLATSNPAQIQAVKDRITGLQAADPDNKTPIPVDLVTASGSGLDPHISPAAANYQVSRVANARKLPIEKVQALVAQYTEDRQWGMLGEPCVNVLRLNLALEDLK